MLDSAIPLRSAQNDGESLRLRLRVIPRVQVIPRLPVILRPQVILRAVAGSPCKVRLAAKRVQKSIVIFVLERYSTPASDSRYAETPRCTYLRWPLLPLRSARKILFRGRVSTICRHFGARI